MKNILMLCDIRIDSPNTIIDYINAFKAYSKDTYYFYNPVGNEYPTWLDLNKFDVIVIHYTVYILGHGYLSNKWQENIKNANVFKAIFIQDEYRTVNAITSQMLNLGIDLLFTCWPDESMDSVYTPQLLPNVKKKNVLTGYVPDYLVTNEPDFESKRSIDVSYRARGNGFFWLGELYQEKRMIGERFEKYVINNSIDLKINLSSKENERFYGDDWLNFLKDSYCVLGTESGASVVDFTGEIESECIVYCNKYPDTTFFEAREMFFKDLENKHYMNQISPRVFEAIGCGCCLILFEGKYSNILVPDLHYIELKKDFSNIDSVIAKIQDKKYLQKMAKRAYTDIILSGNYSYQKFIHYVDTVIEEEFDGFKYENKNISTSQSNVNKKSVSIIVSIKQMINRFKREDQTSFLKKEHKKVENLFKN